MSIVQSPEQVLAEWLNRLTNLIRDVRGWAEELGWKTRQIKIPMEDSPIGKYEAPALLLQQEALEALLQPIACATPETEGVVDLYLLPRYDNVANMSYYKNAWHIYSSISDTSDSSEVVPDERPFSRENFKKSLEYMKNNAGK
jgi:hypothetical protein